MGERRRGGERRDEGRKMGIRQRDDDILEVQIDGMKVSR